MIFLSFSRLKTLSVPSLPFVEPANQAVSFRDVIRQQLMCRMTNRQLSTCIST